MKKNAALIASILFVTGCASSQGQRASYSSYDSPSRYDRADVSVSSTEHIERTSTQTPIAASDVDASTAVSHDASVGSHSGSVSGSVSGNNYDHDGDDVSADSSVRGGSLDARGYDQDANNDELEGRVEPINPGKQADSSIRGGSISARDRNWNQDSEPSSGQRDPERRKKADSSIRGGSVEARGGREAAANDVSESSSFDSQARIDAARENDSRDDFGQGSSATWESDKGYGSVRGSANWNPSDDLLIDGTESESQSTTNYEFNNDASVGGAASSESGSGASSLDDEELNSDLNSSEQLESNISGDIDLKEQDGNSGQAGTEIQSSIKTGVDQNSADSLSSASSSASTTDIYHDESELRALESKSEDMEIEAAGAAASSETGSSTSSNSEFQSNDPALENAGSPLGTSGNEPNFLHKDNRAQGVGSAATGEFATSPVNQGTDVKAGNDPLARKVKERLVSESTGTHGLMMHQVAKNVQVSSQNGELTLTGTVPSEQDKSMIEVRAREIAGVKRVQNNLIVTPQADTADQGINRGSDLEDITSDLQDE